MKKSMILILIALLISATIAIAQDEFSVRFSSFGQNATINLKSILGESQKYLVSQTENVIVTIDQEKGTAFLQARQGWVGSELVLFKRIEAQTKAEDLITKPEEEKPLVPEEMKETKIVYEGEPESNLRFFGGTLDASVVELLKSIKKEDIISLKKVVTKDSIELNINEELDLKIKKGENPQISMDFSLNKKVGDTPIEKKGISKTQNFLFLMLNAFLVIIMSSVIYFYLDHVIQKNKQKMKKR